MYSKEEITNAFHSGNRVLAVKMLRQETGCDIREALDALKYNSIDEIPTFVEKKAKRQLEDAAPDLLAYARAQELREAGLRPQWGHDCEWCADCVEKLKNLRRHAIAKAEGRE